MISRQKQLTRQYETKLHEHLLNVFHSVESRRFANRLGPKIFGLYQRFALVVLYKRSGHSLRRFVQELPESRWVSWLQLREIPCKSTIHSWVKQYSVTALRAFLLQQVEQPDLMAIDATGIDSWQRSRHYERRIGEAPMPYAKIDFLVDTESKIILDHVLRIKPRHDVLGAASIFKRCRLRGKVVADKGYDSEPLHKLARKKGLELYAPVRRSPRLRPRGRYRRKCAAEPDPDYSRRNCVESAIHSFKSRFPSLRSRLHYMKKRELALAVLVYNMEIEAVRGNRRMTIRLSIVIQLLLILDTPIISY
jgi:hypothetical protein